MQKEPGYEARVIVERYYLHSASCLHASVLNTDGSTVTLPLVIQALIENERSA